MQLNPNKEYVKNGIFTLFFKQVEDFGKVNRLAVDINNFQMDVNNEVWFMIQSSNQKQAEIKEFITRCAANGFGFSTKNVSWAGKDYIQVMLTIPDENVIKLAEYFFNQGNQNCSYYDVKLKKSIEAWSV